MVSTNYEIIFEPKPRKIGREWRVVATYPSGQKEHITGFASEGEAIEWLASKSSQVALARSLRAATRMTKAPKRLNVARGEHCGLATAP